MYIQRSSVATGKDHPAMYMLLYAVSKSAQKNRRKKQQQQQGMSGRSQEQRDAVSMATHLMGGVKIEGAAAGGGGSDTEKKIKNLKKVIIIIVCIHT